MLSGSTAITDNAELVKTLSSPSEVLAVALAALLQPSIAAAIFAAALVVKVDAIFAAALVAKVEWSGRWTIYDTTWLRQW